MKEINDDLPEINTYDQNSFQCLLKHWPIIKTQLYVALFPNYVL